MVNQVVAHELCDFPALLIGDSIQLRVGLRAIAINICGNWNERLSQVSCDTLYKFGLISAVFLWVFGVVCQRENSSIDLPWSLQSQISRNFRWNSWIFSIFNPWLMNIPATWHPPTTAMHDLNASSICNQFW